LTFYLLISTCCRAIENKKGKLEKAFIQLLHAHSMMALMRRFFHFCLDIFSHLGLDGCDTRRGAAEEGRADNERAPGLISAIHRIEQ
jgi:hypothetical protein